MRIRLLAVAGVGVLAAAVAAPMFAGSATAASAPKPGAVPPKVTTAVSSGQKCDTVVNYDLTKVHTDADDDKTPLTPTNATATLLSQGVKITTPDTAAKAYARFVPSDAPFDLSSVKTTEYSTWQEDGTTPAATGVLPSFQIQVLETGIAGFTSLVSEPYIAFPSTTRTQNGWQTWNPLDGLWWSTHDVTINGTPVPRGTGFKWADFLSSYPKAVGLNYDVNQGTGNAGAVNRFQDITFGDAAGCTVEAWTNVQPEPSKSTKPCDCTAKPSPSAPAPSPSQSIEPSVVPSVPPTSPPPAALPTTGSSLTLPISGGILMVVIGVALLFFVRNRRGVHRRPIGS